VTKVRDYMFVVTYTDTDGNRFSDEIKAPSWCVANSRAKELNATLDGILACKIYEGTGIEQTYDHEACPIL
jgi:hypothetical protein